MFRWIRRLLCRHSYELIGARESLQDFVSKREYMYRCCKCGNEIWVNPDVLMGGFHERRIRDRFPVISANHYRRNRI